jgi:DNA polymerase III delta prime subunit
VIVLNEVHSLSKSAQNSILDSTEDPPPSTIWILVTTDPAKLLPTLRRRCVTYQLKSLGISDTERFLEIQAKRAGIVRPLADLFEQLHIMQISSPAILLQALEKYAVGNSAIESVAGVDSKIDTYKLCKAVTSGQWKEIVSVMKDATPDDSRWIRASVAGWLRGCLIRESSPQGQERAALSLLDLSMPPFDDAIMIQWLWGTIFKICKRYRT